MASIENDGNSELQCWLRTWTGRVLTVGLLVATLVALLSFVSDSKPVGEIHEAMQERVDAGKLPTVKQVRGTGLYWASLVNAILIGLLLLTCRWWTRPLVGSRFASDVVPMRQDLKVPFAVCLLIIVAGAGYLRWNLVSGSMWWDEAWAMQNIYHGEFEANEDGSGDMTFVSYDNDWRRALWRYGRPLNHPVASLLSQAAQSIWQPMQIGDNHEFEEWVLRLPAFLAGLLAIVLVGVTTAHWGFPWAGVAAAALLALHPWAIRHTSEIRAYPFLLLGAAAGIYFITRILRSATGTWKNWVGFGIALLLIVWSHILAAPLAMAYCLALLIGILFTWRDRTGRTRALIRLVVITLIAAGTFLQIFGPNIVQAISWAESYALKDGNHIGGRAIGQLFCFLGSGLPWDVGNGEEAEHLASAKSIFRANPLLASAASLAFLAALGLGWLILWRQFRIGAWLIFAPLTGAIITIEVIWLADLYFYPRFLIYLLVPVAMLFGIGAASPIYLAKRPNPRSHFIGLGTALASLMLFAIAISPKLRVLNQSSIEPLREVAVGIQEFEDLHTESGFNLQVAGIGHGSARVQLYLPEAISIRDHESLDRMTRKASDENTHLLVFAGHTYFNTATHPDLMATLTDEALFEEIAVFPGIEADFFYRLYRFRKGRDLVPAELSAE